MKKKIFNGIILYVCMFIVGICLLVWADKVTNFVSILLGSLAILYGIGIFVSYFKNNYRSFSDNLYFVYSIVIAILGFVMVFRVDFLKELISFIIGIYIILSSVLQLQEIYNVKKRVNANMKSSVVLSCIGIFVGLLCIVGKFIIQDAIVSFIGIMLIIYSSISFVNMFIIRKW